MFTIDVKKSILWLIVLCTWFFMMPTFAAKIIVQPVQETLYYWCPFDVDILVDAQWEENIWTSIYVALMSGLSLQWITFWDEFSFNFPVKYDWNTFKAYAFKFPWSFTGLVKFATLRLSQNEDIEKNSLVFHRVTTWDTTDWVDVYYMWWMDALKSIENKDFVFSQGDCWQLPVLSGDQLNATFDQQGHLMWLYNAIDDYVNQHKQKSFWVSISSYIYYIASALILILTLILVILYKKWKLNKIFKSNSVNHVE